MLGVRKSFSLNSIFFLVLFGTGYCSFYIWDRYNSMFFVWQLMLSSFLFRIELYRLPLGFLQRFLVL